VPITAQVTVRPYSTERLLYDTESSLLFGQKPKCQ